MRDKFEIGMGIFVILFIISIVAATIWAIKKEHDRFAAQIKVCGNVEDATCVGNKSHITCAVALDSKQVVYTSRPVVRGQHICVMVDP